MTKHPPYRSLRLVLAILLLPASLLFSGCSSSSPTTKVATPSNTGTHDSGKFRNVAKEAGIEAFLHTDGGSGRKFFLEQMGSGVALLDYDGDGWIDIYFCSGQPLPGYTGEKPQNRLFRNKHDGTFEDVTDKAGVACNRYSIGVAVGDFDNDGKPDLYVTCFGGNVLYHNNGDGTFTDVTKQAGVGGGDRLSSSAAWSDYDGDGYLDLCVCNYVKYRLEEDIWCSKTAGKKSYCGPNLYLPETCTLYHNNGNGTFTDVTARSGIGSKAANALGCVWIDYNEDGKPDLFIADDQSPNQLWRNNGNGTFTDVAMEAGVAYGEQGNAQAGMGVDFGDYDNDGRLDLLVTNFSEESNALYHNEGDHFKDVSMPSGMGAGTLMYLGFGTGFLDYDRDGYLDMFFANGHVLDDIGTYSDAVTWKQNNQIFHNRGNGTFEETTASLGLAEDKHVSRGVAFGDLFNEGRPCIVVNVLREHPLLLRNEIASKAHWLELDLHSTTGNPQALGAKVWLKAGGKTQYRVVKTCGSYASSSDPRPLFGLGDTSKVDELKITWPNGKSTVLNNPPIDRILRVENQ